MVIIDFSIVNVFYDRFKTFLYESTKIEFTSFSHTLLEKQEDYKYDCYRNGREKLNFHSWRIDDIGTGKILNSVIESIEIEGNNLVNTHDRFGPGTKDQQSLCDAKKNAKEQQEYEQIFFDLYKSNISDEESLSRLVKHVGKKYALIAYVLFLKNNRKYMPIAPDHFDRIFVMLSIHFKTSGKCSWENYVEYNSIINRIREYLEHCLVDEEVRLLDAHSFLWIIGNQMLSERPDLCDLDNKTMQRPILDEYVEGDEKKFVQTRRERNPRLKMDAISKYGRTCMTCNFNYDNKYGPELAGGYIELHHTKPISETEGERITKLEDVIVVCSNCHRIIHRQNKLLDWKELRERLSKAKALPK